MERGLVFCQIWWFKVKMTSLWISLFQNVQLLASQEINWWTCESMIETQQFILIMKILHITWQPCTYTISTLKKKCRWAEITSKHLRWNSAISIEICYSNKSLIQPVCFISCSCLRCLLRLNLRKNMQVDVLMSCAYVIISVAKSVATTNSPRK